MYKILKLGTRLKKKPLPIPQHQKRSLSFYTPRPKTPPKHLDKALKVLEIVGPRKGTSITRPLDPRNHLRLVQDLLQTDYNQTEDQYISHDFGSSNLVGRVVDVFDRLLEASASDSDEDSYNGSSGYDPSVLSNALSSCASNRDLKAGVQFHCVATVNGFVSNSYVGSCLITLYGKCGELENAYKVFDEMPERNVVSWTAIISGFSQESRIDACLQLYLRMRNSTLEPNDFTFSSILGACTGSGALGQGRSAHCQVIQMGFASYLHVSNALISMYCKCGSLEDALHLFETTGAKDIVSWNSMIAGYALHGLATRAIELFEGMKCQGIKPDGITFLGVLSSCRHAGLLEEGRKYFGSMVEFGVRPQLDHYSCLVDLLGRTGLIEEARNVIVSMPMFPNAVIWGSLLSSCRLHGSIWIGIEAAESRLLLQPSCAATHVLLANLYASVKCWDQVARVRKLMKDRGLRTNPGCSWIEIRKEVYRFRAEDKSSSKMGELVSVMDCLADQMASPDYLHEVLNEDGDYCY